MYQVFVMADAQGRVISVNSSAYLTDMAGWTRIDEGEGDKFHHAQSNYLPLPLTTDAGVYRYKLVEGQLVARTAAEMAPEEEAAKIPEIARANIIAYLQNARADNRAFLDLASPTASDRNAQITKLTRQNIRIMRLLLNDLAGEG